MINVDSLWKDAGATPPPEYLRAVSTARRAACRRGDDQRRRAARRHFYRTTAFTPALIDKIAGASPPTPIPPPARLNPARVTARPLAALLAAAAPPGSAAARLAGAAERATRARSTPLARGSDPGLDPERITEQDVTATLSKAPPLTWC
jgi:hypothetical protein